jgi:hypothetical protein
VKSQCSGSVPLTLSSLFKGQLFRRSLATAPSPLGVLPPALFKTTASPETSASPKSLGSPARHIEARSSCRFVRTRQQVRRGRGLLTSWLASDLSHSVDVAANPTVALAGAAMLALSMGPASAFSTLSLLPKSRKCGGVAGGLDGALAGDTAVGSRIRLRLWLSPLLDQSLGQSRLHRRREPAASST